MQEDKKRNPAPTVSDELALRYIIENLPGHVYWKNKNGVYLGCNDRQAKSIGLERGEQLIGKSDADLPWPDESAQQFRENDLKVVKTGESVLVEEQALVDGRIVDVLSEKIPIKDDSDEVVGVLGISLDISKLKQVQKELIVAKQKAEAANRAKSEFIANMSHDIRTPIAGMLGMVQDILGTVRKVESTELALPIEKKLNQLVQTVRRDSDYLIVATNELLQLCNEILDVARLDSGEQIQITEPFSLESVINHNMQLLRPVAEHKRLVFDLEFSSRLPKFLLGQKTYLDRSLLNLLSNALKFTEKGFVKLVVKPSPSSPQKPKLGDKIEVVIKVVDSGIGIPSSKFQEIFEHLSRLNPSYEGIYKGSGLGLYTVKQYVHSMEGTIDVESVVGRGTTFTMKLPFVVGKEPKLSQKEALISQLSQESSSKSQKNTYAPKILVVEDNPTAAMATTLALENLGCYFDLATTGNQALEQINKNSYDLILMDIGLPDILGTEVARTIRAMKDTQKSSMPIIALTGHADEREYRQACFDAGIQEIISKPARPLAIESVINRFAFGTAEEGPDETNQGEDVIDWATCLRMCMGDRELLNRMLATLDEDLKRTRSLLEDAFDKKDLSTLRSELHRCRGGICYLKLPELERALSDLHESIRKHSIDSSKTEKAFNRSLHAIDNFMEVYRRSLQ